MYFTTNQTQIKLISFTFFFLSHFMTCNAQDFLIQKKIDSLQREKEKLEGLLYPKQIERLVHQNDSLEKEKYKLLTLVETIDLRVNENQREISSLQRGLPLPKFEKTIVTIKTSIPLKSSPDLSSDIISWLSTGDKLDAIDYINNDWIKVNLSGRIGYILSSYMKDYPEVISQISKFKNYKEILQTQPAIFTTNTITSQPINSQYIKSQQSVTNYNTPSSSSSYGTSRNIITGPRGGRYYINSNGNKTYIKRK